MTDPIAISTGPHPDSTRIQPGDAAKSAISRRPFINEIPAGNSMTGSQRFLPACLRQPVDRAPVWFLRQAGRYMAEYQAVRRHHSLLQICKNPALAAEVTITAAEKLDVDAAILFSDLLLPFEPMGGDFEFQSGEGPVVQKPIRTFEDVKQLRTDRVSELDYVAEAIQRVV